MVPPPPPPPPPPSSLPNRKYKVPVCASSGLTIPRTRPKPKGKHGLGHQKNIPEIRIIPPSVHPSSASLALRQSRLAEFGGEDGHHDLFAEYEWEGEGWEWGGEHGEWDGEGKAPGKKRSQRKHKRFPDESSELSSDESIMSEASGSSSVGYQFEDNASDVSTDRGERRYLIDAHSFIQLKDPGLETALLPEEEPPKKVYRGRKAERQKYKELCDELGVKPLKAFLERMRGEVMDLRNYGLGEKDIVAICKILAENKHIDTLLLSGNYAGKAGGEAIAEMIETNTRITHLDIGGTAIQPAMKKICDAIKINTVLESIDFSMDELTDKEMACIADFLLENFTLRELFLQHNKITDDGLVQLSKGFLKPGKSKKKGAPVVSETATPNETIALLDLGWNRIKGGKQTGQFFEVMAKHPNLKFFNIAGNSLNNARGVNRILGLNKNLELMSIAYNRIPGKMAASIGQSLAFTESPLKHFVAGPNLWRQKQGAQMILPLTAPKSVVPLEILDMSLGMCVGRKFLKSKRKVWKVRPELQIIHAGNPYGVAKVKPVDGQEVTIKRAQTVCENFATPLEMLIDELRTEPKTMTQDEFKKFIKSCDLYKDRVLTETFFKYFPKGTASFASDVDCEAIIAVYDRLFPKTGGKSKKLSPSAEALEDEEEEEEEAEGEGDHEGHHGHQMSLSQLK